LLAETTLSTIWGGGEEIPRRQTINKVSSQEKRRDFLIGETKRKIAKRLKNQKDFRDQCRI
jgi:hypothetical protein